MKRLPAIAALSLIALLASACHRDSVATPEPQASPASAPASNASPVPTPATPSIPTTPPTPETTAANPSIVLAAGQSTGVAPDASLAFVRVVNDSRCPANVQCVWAGEVTLALALTASGNAASAFEMSTGSRAKTSIAGFDLELVSYQACPAGVVAAAGAECATFTVVTTPE